MILSTKALLDRNPDPTRAEVMEGLRGNLCRCTGYVKILDAVEAAKCLLEEQRVVLEEEHV
jgi:aerobic-type carbon monoxide dehydrogenase small subunit (CoxS/CutS family)